MSRTYPREEINQCRDLIGNLSEVEAMVGVCREACNVEATAEMIKVSKVLLISVNRLNNLIEEQSIKLEAMEIANNEAEDAREVSQ